MNSALLRTVMREVLACPHRFSPSALVGWDSRYGQTYDLQSWVLCLAAGINPSVMAIDREMLRRHYRVDVISESYDLNVIAGDLLQPYREDARLNRLVREVLFSESIPPSAVCVAFRALQETKEGKDLPGALLSLLLAWEGLLRVSGRPLHPPSPEEAFVQAAQRSLSEKGAT